MMTEEERAHRAGRVKELTENEHFVEAVSNVDAAYIKAWRNAKTWKPARTFIAG
jgi:hypothetical protein